MRDDTKEEIGKAILVGMILAMVLIILLLLVQEQGVMTVVFIGAVILIAANLAYRFIRNFP